MDLIYTNKDWVDQGVLLDYELDLAFGADENDLECRIQADKHCCEAGSLLYIEGTEYGGIVDSIESDTDSSEVVYYGRTWHGILDSKVIEPDEGADYISFFGDANGVLSMLISRLSLSSLFSASTLDSGIEISFYKMDRYISGYAGIKKMLKSAGAKLKTVFDGSKVILSAEPIHDYANDEEFDADLVPFKAKKSYRSINHLICLGSGELSERIVVHLYADENGNISDTQTQTGINEVTSIYEYSSISTAEELKSEGTKKFKEILSSDEISLDFDADSDVYDVGDIIGAHDNITGLSAYANIEKKIVTIKNGTVTIRLSPDTAKQGSSMESGGSKDKTITVDSELSSTSENPVQNKVVYNALEEKQDSMLRGTYTGDIDSATAYGTYFCNLSQCTNGPSNTGYGWLEVGKSEKNSSVTIQRFTFYQNGETYTRTYINSKWYDWFSLAGSVSGWPTMCCKLLLTRSSGWSSGQSVSIPELADCDFALILYCGSTAFSTSNLRHVVIPVGSSSTLEAIMNMGSANYFSVAQRTISISSDGTVSSGGVFIKGVNSNSAATDNTNYPYALSPYKIYGLKL